MTTHPSILTEEPRITAGYGSASRAAILLVVTGLAALGVLVVWALTAVLG